MISRALDTPRVQRSKVCKQCGGSFTAGNKGGTNFARAIYCGWACYQIAKTYTPEQRLEAAMRRVVKAESGCWLFQGARDQWGHAHLGVRQGTKNRRTLAHRFFYEALVGPIPEGRFCLHRCNVAHCVNPEHLYLGDLKDNKRDHLDSGKGFKFSRERVAEIRRKSAEGKTDRELAEEYGTVARWIWAIRTNRAWKTA